MSITWRMEREVLKGENKIEEKRNIQISYSVMPYFTRAWSR
jgi:hypothetical protein